MVVEINMIVPLIKTFILTQVNGTLVITRQHINMFLNKPFSHNNFCSISARNSTSLVVNETHFSYL
jgi:hypothetical protein